MSAEETSEAFARTPGARPLARTVPVLLLLLGLVFMHGACVTAGIAAGDGGTHPPITASAVAELTSAGHSPDHPHHSDHASCCSDAVEAGCIALLAATFLLLAGLSRNGAGVLLSARRSLRSGVPLLRASPQAGLPRSVLCVMRV
ncbi:hypothetical protein [Actinomadura sp. HBU206391]|uniref:hypothetical protein n=1 Tax=Actinomadura sp. HBU206391 TaxID=2731692 RepID=UPI00164FF09B|nr:hypothetical protein [Actinomadura sp. HBU206391]MBC6460160.1 hypothetical protein [Actinomadura sp. HBU206391]